MEVTQVVDRLFCVLTPISLIIHTYFLNEHHWVSVGNQSRTFLIGQWIKMILDRCTVHAFETGSVLPSYTWRFCFVPLGPQHTLSFLVQPYRWEGKYCFSSFLWILPICFRPLCGNSFARFCLEHGPNARALLCHKHWRSKSTTKFIWGPGFPRPLFPSDQNLPWEVSQGLVMSNDASLVEGCCQDLLHSHYHRDVGCTGIQGGESATSWCLLHETLFISYAGALRLPN